MEKIPFQEGEPPPGDGYVLANIQDEDGESKGKFWIRADDLQQGSIQHEDVEALVPPMRWVWRHLKKHLTWCRSFEDFELGFLRDTHPEKEVAVWLKATYAYLQYCHENGSSANKEGVFQGVSLLMNGRADAVKPKSAAKRLQKLMGRGFPVKLFDVENFTEDGHLIKGEKHLR